MTKETCEQIGKFSTVNKGIAKVFRQEIVNQPGYNAGVRMRLFPGPTGGAYLMVEVERRKGYEWMNASEQEMRI